MAARVALVTGGSRGIGAAAALALARGGCDVAITYRRDHAAAQQVVEAVEESGRQGFAIQCDLADPRSPALVMASGRKRFDQVDVLVNNAAEASITDFDRITADEWDRLFHVNVRAAFLLAQLAVREMRSRRWGRIINVASQAGISGGLFVGTHYAASKGALLTLTRSLARSEAIHNVLVNAVAPGLVATDMVAGFPEQRVIDAEKAIPLGRLADPAEVGAVIAFLASDAASYITGATIHVNGGLLIA